MADQANLFTASAEDPTASAPQPTAQPSPAPQASQPAPAPIQVPAELQGLIGEGNKYANVQAALASVAPAQAHIATIEQDNASLKQQVADLTAKLQQATSMEDVLAKLTVNQQPQATQPAASGLDEQAVLNLLNQREAARVAEQNQVSVTTALVTQFGGAEQAKQALLAKAQEFGVDFTYMQNLAAQSPKAVLAYFGTQTPAATAPQPQATTTAPFQQPPKQEMSFVANAGDTNSLVEAFRNCGKAINGGEEINHRY